ncbi:hypothetical protein ABZ608_40925 [Streptomyces sp. NPDC013172]|uniref:trypsin-like serine peptidase n=1 Tax=unclassified Streptomyces TaxID=2593676 RepID=UPI0033FED4D3
MPLADGPPAPSLLPEEIWSISVMSASRKTLFAVTAVAAVAIAIVALLPGGGASGASASRLNSWLSGDWKDWATAKWKGGSDDFYNPTIPGLWSGKRMSSASSPDAPISDSTADEGTSDPEPRPVAALAAAAPYHVGAGTVGKVFFDSPDGPKVCSGTAVRDPARPGRSDLVWTAGHCAHAGAKGGWFRNVVFVPSYNDDDLPANALNTAPIDKVAPFGVWWADKAAVSPQWMAQGSEVGGAGAPFDFAVLRVTPPTGDSSLEETLGDAVPVRFDVPAVNSLAQTSAWGYPADAPFDGDKLYSCQDRPTRFSPVSDQPTMYRIGCTMTGGASGGGWFALGPDGTPELISNTSVGPADNTWLAGPHLGAQAKLTLEAVSRASGAASPSP